MPMKILMIIAILAVPLIPTFWAILDIPKRSFPTQKSKMVWFLTVSTFPCVGAILYILFGRRRTLPLEQP